MTNNKPKILLAKPGLDGHDVGVKVLGHALVEAGFTVIYSGLRNTIEEIVGKALEHNAGIIGLSILSGTHLELCRQMASEMQSKNLSIPWIAGGNIPDQDVEKIKALGAAAAFPTGTTIDEVLEYFKKIA